MPGGRPKLPTELKKLKGTYIACRDKGEEKRDKLLASVPAAIIPPDTRLPVPKCLTDTYVRKFYKKLTAALVAIKVLSPVDLPHVEQLCFVLQNLRAVQDKMSGVSVFDADYDLWLRRYVQLSDKFDRLGAKFYLSPADRAKLHLEELTIQKTEQEIQKNDTAIGRLLSNRS